MTSNTPHSYRYSIEAYPHRYTLPCLKQEMSAVHFALSSLKTTTFSIKDLWKHFHQYISWLLNCHKDIKCFQQMNNTQEVLNVKVRLKSSIGQCLNWLIIKIALNTIIISKAHNSKSKSHGLVFVISPVSKENGTYYWRKQCSCYIYYCLYFHFLMILFLQHSIEGSVKVVNVLPCLWKEDVFTFLYSL